jgi:hypothetical protein
VSRSLPEGEGSGQPLLAWPTSEVPVVRTESLLHVDGSSKLGLVRSLRHGDGVGVGGEEGRVRKTSSDFGGTGPITTAGSIPRPQHHPQLSVSLQTHWGRSWTYGKCPSGVRSCPHSSVAEGEASGSGDSRGARFLRRRKPTALCGNNDQGLR